MSKIVLGTIFRFINPIPTRSPDYGPTHQLVPTTIFDIPAALVAPLHYLELKFTLYTGPPEWECMETIALVPTLVLTEFSFFDFIFFFLLRSYPVISWTQDYIPTKLLDIPAHLLFIHNITTILHIEIFVVIKQRIKDRFQCSDEKLFYHEPSKSKVVTKSAIFHGFDYKLQSTSTIMCF